MGLRESLATAVALHRALKALRGKDPDMIAIWGNEVQIVESAFLKLFGPVRDEKVHGSTHYFAEYGGTGVCAVQEQDRTETKRTEQELRRDLEALVELNKEFRDLKEKEPRIYTVDDRDVLLREDAFLEMFGPEGRCEKTDRDGETWVHYETVWEGTKIAAAKKK